ncbi:precorrin-2 C(20)-methyltransferase [uncultured Neptuniibacter sp.]|uniref:precorrin-2 C(20)-methyltransferase n=1 Tax=uncultured Neptuniibacter sp. TaxID=502143 RepID=UPI00260A3C4A|nr:precorrin-2 C(20)-methyltransferase [uncultured Neptuniibacter sp.]
MNLVKGRFIGVGVGPGDPELLTVKAWRLIQSADVISYLVNEKGESQAKKIASDAIYSATSAQSGIPIYMPMLTERERANRAYDQGAEAIAEQLEHGLDVIFLCEGDPLFFGSFSYLLERLQGRYTCEVVPGITSVNAAAATLVQPLTMLKESFAVINGRHSDEQILTALQQHDSLVIMKAGQARPRLLKLLDQSGRTDDARYLEYIGRDNQRIVNDISTLEAEAGPYFSLFVITRSERQSR